MKQVNKVKAISALPIHSRDIFFKKRNINASKENIYSNIKHLFLKVRLIFIPKC